MTDEELIAQLLDWPTCGWNEVIQMRKDAACRIEALLKERYEAINQLDSALFSVEVLEKRVEHFMAKLARAVEALRAIDIAHNEQSLAGRIARAALAELESK